MTRGVSPCRSLSPAISERGTKAITDLLMFTISRGIILFILFSCFGWFLEQLDFCGRQIAILLGNYWSPDTHHAESISQLKKKI